MKRTIHSPNGKKKILIAEDENIIAMDIQYILQNLGYKVSDIVSTGEESIDRASKKQPDLILMDIKLKGDIDGVSAAEQIFSRFNIPVVYLTACGDEKTMNRVRNSGHFGFISKPFEERELQAVIKNTLA